MPTGVRTPAAVVLVGMLTIAASSSGHAQQQQAAQQAPQQPMSFFITSVGPGNGGNLGGLAGADKQCQTRAAAAGAGT